MQLAEFIVFVESVEDEIKKAYPISSKWKYKEEANAFTATCESSAKLLQGRYQIHLWKNKNVASLLKLSNATPTKLKDLAL